MLAPYKSLIKIGNQLSNFLAADLQANNSGLEPVKTEALARSALFSLLILRLIQAWKITPPAATALDQARSAHFMDKALRPALQTYNQALSTDVFTLPFEPPLIFSDEALHSVVQQLFAFETRLDLETLAYLYERLANSRDLKKEGIFYTPLPIAKRVVREALGEWLQRCAENQSPTILDPACGSGIFLLEAARFLTARQPKASFSAKAAALKNSIFGVDKDPQAVAMTRLLLTLFLLEDRQLDLFPLPALDLSTNIKCGNSLLDPGDPHNPEQQRLDLHLGAFSWSQVYPTIMHKGGFDCIIGNPPYGLARDEQISPVENERLKKLYHAYRHGKINKYLAFMAKGHQLLNANGILSFIVPNAWLGIKGGSALRRLFIKEKSLQSVTVFKCRVFDEPGVEAVIFRVDKGRQRNYVDIETTSSIEEGSAMEHFKLPLKACEEAHDFQIPITWSKAVCGVLNQIDSNSFKLGSAASPFVPLIALQAYALGKGRPPQTREHIQKHAYHCSTKEDEFCYPYLEGAGVQRYKTIWSGLYLKYGPWLAEPQVLSRFSGPRLLIREVINPPPYLLNAAFAEETMLYNKSVLHIRLKEQVQEDSLLALLALLNSKLASFIILQRGRKSQRRLFPKIVNDDLKDFQLPVDFASQVKNLSALAQQMLDYTLRGAAAQELTQVQGEIDNAVYSAFGLKNSQVKDLEESLAPRN